MTEPVAVLITAPSDPPAEAGEVAAAVTEAVSDAFRQGVYAGEDAARRDESDTVSREEYDALLARLEAVEGRAVVAEVVAEAAVEVALDAAGDQTDGGGGGDEGVDAEPESDEPAPPERVVDAPPATPPAAPPERGYGSGWYHNRKG